MISRKRRFSEGESQMADDDAVYETIRTLLRSGALAKEDLSPESLLKIEEAENVKSEVSSMSGTTSREGTATPDMPKRAAVNVSQDGADSYESLRPLTESELHHAFTREDAEDLITLRKLVDAGLVDVYDWNRAMTRVLRSRSTSYSIFKRSSESPRHRVDIDDALRYSDVLRWIGLVVGCLGILSGLIITFQTRVDQICDFSSITGSPFCYDGETSHPYWAIGIGVLANSFVFGVVLMAVASYMKARLLQSDQQLRR
jgi:hypothetical protein